MDLKLDRAGWERKRRALLTTIKFFENAPRDGATYFQEAVVSGVINGQYVGVISGMLKRSVEVLITSRFSAAVVSDLGIAPYSIEVRERTFRKYGEDFYQITLRIYGDDAYKALFKEFKRMMSIVARGGTYEYQNQLPII
jgi:hypothetical protein